MRCVRGFGYWVMLVLVAVGGATMAAIGERAAVTTARDRQAELVFRGRDIARAIGRWREATPGPAKQWPDRLEELLDDRRSGELVRHLRQVWRDPYTGEADWEPVPADDGTPGLRGVRSRSSRLVFAVPLAEGASAARGQAARARDHVFVHEPASAASAAH